MSFDNFVSELSLHSPFAVWSVVFIYGLMIGSFLNVLIYRLPIQILDKETNAKSSRFKFNSICTRSMCPHCASKIAWYHNFPLISWLMLRGRSSCCGKPISIRYPLVELAGGVAPLMVGLYFGLSWTTLLYTITLWAVIGIFVIDFKHFLIPDSMILSIFVSGGVASYMGLTEHSFWVSMISSIISMITMYLIGKAYSRYRGYEVLGFGDVKLIGAFVMWLGPMGAPLVFVYSVLGMPMLFMGNVFERDEDIPKNAIPYGPILIIGFFVAMLCSSQLNLGVFMP